MPDKRLTGFIAVVAAIGLVAPLSAQQAPNPNQPTPNAPSPVAPNQPAIPGQQVPPQSPMPPPRFPGPAQRTAPGPQQGQPVVPQPQSTAPGVTAPAASATTPAGETASAPSVPQRRFASPAPSGGMISLNFNRADLVEVIHIIAQQLRLNYTIDPEVKGTVTINSAEPLRSEDLLPIFHQILRMNGAVAIRSGDLYQITPIKEGKGLARPVGQNKDDSFALQVVPVRFFSVAEMKRVLTPFLQPGGEIVDNPRGNFLVIMDLPSNIQRLMEIADLIDVQVFAGTRMELYQPKIASAEELAQEMTKVMQSYASSAPQAENFVAEFIPLPRINQLLVISHSEAAWTYAKRWLDRIDVVAEGPGRRIFIYPVENGKAEDLATILTQALGLPSTGGTKSTQTLQELHRSMPGLSPSTGTSGFGTGGFPSTSSSFGSPSSSFGSSSFSSQPGYR